MKWSIFCILGGKVDLKSDVYCSPKTNCLHQIWQLWPNFRTCLIKIAHHIISSSIKLKFHDFFFLIFVRLSSGNINHLLSPPSGEKASFQIQFIHLLKKSPMHLVHCTNGMWIFTNVILEKKSCKKTWSAGLKWLKWSRKRNYYIAAAMLNIKRFKISIEQSLSPSKGSVGVECEAESIQIIF